MRKTLVVAAVLTLAGCSGGGGGALTPVQPPAATAAPTTAPTSSPTTSIQSAKLTLRFPVSSGGSKAKVRSPQFVDGTNAAALVTIINTYNGSATLPAWLSPYASTTTALATTGPTPNCSVTAGVETCTVSIPAPAGTVNYTFNVTDASSVVLSTSTATETLTQGAANTISDVTLQGVLGSVTVTAPTLTANTAVTGTLLPVVVADPDGATITGNTTPFNGSTVTLASNNTHVTLALGSGGTYGSSVTLVNPGDAANVYYAYDGQAQAANAVTITATKTTGGTTLGSVSISTVNSAATFTGLTLADTAHGANSAQPNYNAPTEFFSGTAQSESFVTASELGFTNSPYGQALTAAADAGCGTIIGSVSIGAVSGGSQTITVTSGSTAGICKINVSDGLGDDTFFWASVSTGSFSVN